MNTFWKSSCTFFDIETVNGLANIDSGGRDGDFLGVLINEPITAKRESNEGCFDRTEWAHGQYEIICKNGLSDEDKLYLPYVLGKYRIDITDIMFIKVMNKRNGVNIYNLKKLIEFLAANEMQLIIGLSSFTKSLRAENYIDSYRSLQILDVSEFLFLPVKNSGFLGLQENDAIFPNNILWCIMKICKGLKICLNKQIKDNKVVSVIGGSISALVFSFEKTEN